MKALLRTHGKKLALGAATIAATGAAYYWGGPVAAAKVQELLPAILSVFGAQ